MNALNGTWGCVGKGGRAGLGGLGQPAALGGGVPQDRLRLVPTLGRQPGDALQHALRGHAVLHRQDGVGLFLAPVHLQK